MYLLFLQKLQVFLFDHALVLTRNATRGDKITYQVYQVYRQPLPLKTLVVETEEGGKLSGSFRGGLLSGDKGTKLSYMFYCNLEKLFRVYDYDLIDRARVLK